METEMIAAPTWQLYDGAAETYERHRPRYPLATLQALKARLGALALAGRAVDAGAGTGIFSRQLLQALPELADLQCVEPNQDMIEVGTGACGGFPKIFYSHGFAEALPVADARVVLVTAATAANWFDRPVFFREVLRVLVPGGLLALLQNKPRFWDDPLVADFSAFQERCIPGYKRGTYSDFNGGYGRADFEAELREHGSFDNVIKHTVPWDRSLTPDEFRGYCYSMGHIKKAEASVGAARVAAEIDELIERHIQPDGALCFGWMAELTMANAPVVAG
jgi:ubiquinone/menaquinone biosynthesis C-methylase UbiE